NDGPTIPIGRIVQKRVSGIFGLVIRDGVNPLIPSATVSLGNTFTVKSHMGTSPPVSRSI
ncbi:MAG TPA: hypothetical protein VEL11_00730, partial [Candidatus Bathyarchaeia archaeon]|nr:hypothetical protein [Candidatus Bathyarchaeia archaeon]